MTDYHNPDSCNKCKGQNIFIKEIYDNAFLCEVQTKCSECGFEDYWAYGFFESSTEMKSNCETYNFNNKG